MVVFSCWVVSNPLRPMDYSMSDFPALHYLLQFAQIHVHWVGDAIQPSHPLWSPSPPAFNLSRHPGLFKWVNMSCELLSNLAFCLHNVAKRPVITFLQTVNTLVCLCSLTYLFIWVHWILVMVGRSLLHHLSSVVTSLGGILVAQLEIKSMFPAL